jgi:virginiamycin A acetyltransferase
MKKKIEIRHGEYARVEYRMFNESRIIKILMKTMGVISLPFILPLLLAARLFSDIGFKMASECLSKLPSAIGVSVRREFYRRTLRRCGENVYVFFGAVFFYPEISLGSNVVIDSRVSVHHCDIGDNVMVGAGSHLLSGSRYHQFDRTDIPIIRQPGQMKRIRIGNDVWIGVGSIIMADVGEGAVVGAGSVVTRPVEPFCVVAGNPAKLIKRRK